MNKNNKINYIELPAYDLPATKKFFEVVFGWSFIDYGPQYTAMENAGIDGGFFRADLASTTERGGALVILYVTDLEATLRKVEEAGGKITKPIFDFPGGRRFHFLEPSGNELAAWAEPIS